MPLSLGLEAQGLLWALKGSRDLAMVSGVTEGEQLTYVAARVEVKW